jgi:hypothetical protein
MFPLGACVHDFARDKKICRRCHAITDFLSESKKGLILVADGHKLVRVNSGQPSLFKYLAASEEKLFLFENSSVMVTPPMYLNDPWDFLATARSFTKQELEQAGPNVETDYPQFFQAEISKMCGIVSLTEKPLCRLMWAHYAESYTGFVAEFDAPYVGQKYGRAMRASAVGPAVQVGYDARAEQFVWDKNDIFDACCTKHPHWQYEQEWRVISPLSKLPKFTSISSRTCVTGERICWSFEPERLHRVIFGMRMKPETKSRLLKMLRCDAFKHVNIQTTAVDPKTGELIALESSLRD